MLIMNIDEILALGAVRCGRLDSSRRRLLFSIPEPLWVSLGLAHQNTSGVSGFSEAPWTLPWLAPKLCRAPPWGFYF